MKCEKKPWYIVCAAILISAHGASAQSGLLSKHTYSGRIYLYGESHGVEKIIDKEFQLWHDYYHNKKMRHLFVELPYYTAVLLNLWMKDDNDDILKAVYDDWRGTAFYNPHTKNFFMRIKDRCPETIFHGTDVGHQYATTGARYIQYLEDNALTKTENYRLAKEAVQQGKEYYSTRYQQAYRDTFRENAMSANCIRELEKLGAADVMGIYGAAHTALDALTHDNAVPCMAAQLKMLYGAAVHSEDLSWLAKELAAIRVDSISLDGKKYAASYFGRQNLQGFKDYAYREFWRVEAAYEAVRMKPLTGDVLPNNNYPMLIQSSQVFVIDYTKTDGSVLRSYYRSDGNLWQGLPATEEFICSP